MSVQKSLRIAQGAQAKSHTVREPEALYDGQQSAHRKEARAFLHLFCDDPTSPPSYYTINLAQHISYIDRWISKQISEHKDIGKDALDA